VHRLLREDPRLPGKRVRELLEEQGYAGGKTIVDDHLREGAAVVSAAATHLSADLVSAGRALPVRSVGAVAGDSGRRRPDATWLRRGCLPYSRAGAATLVFSKEAPDLLYGIGRCLARLGGLPETLVWDSLHAHGLFRIAFVRIAHVLSSEPGWKAVFEEPDGSESQSRILGWAVVGTGEKSELVG
jgi:hypothetical protein